jgi:antitoxin component YwqK of YwqJK toxin-antitoxin module
MRNLHAVALVALLSVVGQVQSQSESRPRTMADITYALKGPVKTFRTEVTTFVLKDGQYVEGPRVLREEAWFNRDGNRTSLHSYQNGRLAGRIVMKFEGRKNVESINYDGNGRMLLRSVKLYDEAGVVQGSRTYDGNGTLLSIFSLKRNSRGQVVESTEHNAAGVLLMRITNKYEGDERYISEHKTYSPDGSLKSEVVFTAPNKRTEIRYARNGSVTFRSVRIGQEEAQYGADGTVQKATVINSGDRLLDEMNIGNDGSKTRVTQLPDEIDQHGNWTKQTTWFADPKGARPLGVKYRALTYHEN